MSVTESSSQLERLAACAASGALPQIRSVSPWSERGRVVHRFLEQVRTLGREAALVDVDDEHRPLCEAIDLDALPKGTWTAELALAWNVYTGEVRQLGAGGDRDDAYSTVDPLTEIPGTLDGCGLSVSEVFVPDWKTGWSPVAPPAKNKQLRFNALLAAREYGRHSAVIELVRIREDGKVIRQRAELDAFELVVVEQEARVIHDRVMAARAAYLEKGDAGVEPVEGPWCRYCPAYPICPAKTRLALAIAGGDAADEQQLAEGLTDEKVRTIWPRLKAARALLARVEEAVRGYTYARPVYLGEETWLGRVDKPGNEQLDGRIAWAVLAEMRGRKVADEEVEIYVSKKAVETAVRRTLAKGEKISHATKAVIEAVRDRGGTSRKPTSTIAEYPGPAPAGRLPEGGQ